MSLQEEVSTLFLQVLHSSPLEDSDITKEDVDAFLQEDLPVVDQYKEPDLKVVGYPSHPLYLAISARLCQWMETGNCPVDKLPKHNLLEETNSTLTSTDVRTQTGDRLKDLYVGWASFSGSERIDKLEGILKLLGRRGLMNLLGMRRTVGSKDLWPPPRSTLENTFNSKHRPDNIKPCDLTTGARALSKHCHRDVTVSWWGTAKGPVAKQNDHAFKVVTRILDEATWINIHSLPNEVLILEIRQQDGYGARWSHDGLNFRGFVEPMMENGHEVGWRH
ncbi:uncharacterized protein LOC106172320 [Lingula anatina]|uniref:Uncharacterized protein LOC106172320 n=1 Tax=Lingula anatina TaxID=7574 RepID=A0A1S3JE24_LINAN|nr:uncharacterized protein LOC106172320 [Lingula anatina]|eukprot:XP_013408421.1 uncharacterized protein LOC106172320 [Lingula anatina]